VTEFWRGRDQRQFAYWRAQTSQSAAILAGSGELTGAGTRFVGGMRETLADWSDDPVAAADLRVAEVCGRVSEVAWRLAYRGLSQAQLAPMLSAWHRGAPAPPGLEGAERDLGSAAEARIIRAVRQDDPDLPDGDRALLNGDPARAVELYAGRIGAGTATDDDWAGLVVALGGSPRPEVCRETYTALAGGDAAVHPRDVVLWCSRAG
jgi:hypothetical protein